MKLRISQRCASSDVTALGGGLPILLDAPTLLERVDRDLQIQLFQREPGAAVEPSSTLGSEAPRAQRRARSGSRATEGAFRRATFIHLLQRSGIGKLRNVRGLFDAAIAASAPRPV